MRSSAYVLAGFLAVAFLCSQLAGQVADEESENADRKGPERSGYSTEGPGGCPGGGGGRESLQIASV